jgi:3-oxoacyl-[acyl-carrier-protein] synthase-3
MWTDTVILQRFLFLIALSEAVEQKRMRKGDIVVLVAFGAGLTWGDCVIRW